MSTSNYDSADADINGLKLPKDTSREDVVRLVADELLNKAPGVFGEIDTSSSTPAELQGFASTITGMDGGTGAGHASGGRKQVTLYWKNDPGLSRPEGEKVARLMRLQTTNYSGRQALVLEILDTHQSETQWALSMNTSVADGPAQDEDSRPYDWDHYLDEPRRVLMVFPNADGGGTSGSSTLNTDCTFFFWCGTNWLHMRSKADVTGRILGRETIFTVEPPADQHFTRDDLPTIYSANFSHGGEHYPHLTMPGIKVKNASRNGYTSSELGFIPNYRDAKNREFFQRVHAHVRINQLNAWLGYISGVRFTRDTKDISYFAETIVDGVPYICIDKVGGRAWLVEARTTAA